MEFNSVNEILDYAIVRELAAADFYTDLAGRMDRKRLKEVFLGFAGEELGHKAKLMEVKEGKQMLASEKQILAMKAEKNAFRLYNNLANATDDANLKVIFIGLANEEAKHKLRFEIEYDDAILAEN